MNHPLRALPRLGSTPAGFGPGGGGGEAGIVYIGATVANVSIGRGPAKRAQRLAAMDLTSGNSRAFLLVVSLVVLLEQVWPQSTTGDNREICLQPPLKGPCRALYVRWYYDRATQTCQEFSFGGCVGNDNNFLSFEECSKTCGRIKKVPKICRLKSDEGICRGLMRKYYFSLETMSCEKFYYGGCLGNQNRFDDKDSCMNFCLPKRNTPSFCSNPKDVGICSSSVPRFYYNIDTGDCEEFTYTGCGGNINNFLTRKSCLKACKKGGRKIPPATGSKYVVS
ncbi:tissue factor pathway inhibitor 2-like [Podarcis muralis]